MSKAKRPNGAFYVMRETARKGALCGVHPRPLALDEHGWACSTYENEFQACYRFLREVVGPLRPGQQVRVRFTAERLEETPDAT